MNTEQLIEDLGIRIKQVNKRISEINQNMAHNPFDYRLPNWASEKQILIGKQKAFEETINHINGFAVWDLR